MIKTAEQFIRLRSSNDPADYRRAATERAPLAIWIDIITRHPMMRTWVILNRTVPGTLLGLLATDHDWRVRAIVASRRKLPMQLCELLAADASDDVRFRIACNSATPLHVLHALVDDDVDRVRFTAKVRLEVLYASEPIASCWPAA